MAQRKTNRRTLPPANKSRTSARSAAPRFDNTYDAPGIGGSSDANPSAAGADRGRTSDDAVPSADGSAVTDAPTPRLAMAEKRLPQAESMRDSKLRVLFKHVSPVLSVETKGPRQLRVNHPATYTVTIKNAGATPAAEVAVRIGLPPTVEAAGVEATLGAAAMLAASELEWKIDRLEGHGEARLEVRLLPKQSQPFDLTLRWTCAAVGAQTTIEVVEPKLELAVSGPREVVCGDKEIYRLSLSNPGTSAAENVVVHLLPLTSDDGQTSRQVIGTLAAGDTKVIEIELAARQPGQLTIQADATADDDLKASATEVVTVRSPALALTVSGTKRHYAGAHATYEIRLKNTGDAPAQRVRVSATLPDGAEFLSSTNGGVTEAKRNQVSWSFERLAPGDEKVLSVKCTVKTPGANRLEATATADGDLEQTGSHSTEVLGLADLALDVTDPSGPVPVGDDVTYDVHVRNRGNKDAERVDVVVYFSQGIEPTAVEGGPHEISTGTVVIKTIDSVPAGKERVYKIKARANTQGTHRVRAELQCAELGTSLSEEETTMFYVDDEAASADSPNDSPADDSQAAAGGSAPKPMRLSTKPRRQPSLK